MVDHHIVSIAVIPARFDNLSAIRRYNWRAINAFAVRPVDVNRFVVTAISTGDMCIPRNRPGKLSAYIVYWSIALI